MTKNHNFIQIILTVVCIGCFSILSNELPCMAAPKTTTNGTPLLSVLETNQGYIFTITTDAPLYMLEWDTDPGFAHKQVHALCKGKQYDAFLQSNKEAQLTLQFPDCNATYYIRAFGIYPDGHGDYSMSKASKKIQVGTASETNLQQSKKKVKLTTPTLKASRLKKEKCLQLVITLPQKSTGYMIECSAKKSFCYKAGHPLYVDDGNYVVRWNEHVSKRKQTIKIPLSEFAGNQTYIRVYAIRQDASANTTVISPPSTIKKVSWK